MWNDSLIFHISLNPFTTSDQVAGCTNQMKKNLFSQLLSFYRPLIEKFQDFGSDHIKSIGYVDSGNCTSTRDYVDIGWEINQENMCGV